MEQQLEALKGIDGEEIKIEDIKSFAIYCDGLWDEKIYSLYCRGNNKSIKLHDYNDYKEAYDTFLGLIQIISIKQRKFRKDLIDNIEIIGLIRIKDTEETFDYRELC